MMFASTGLFKLIQCPNGEQCSLTNCIFSHEVLRGNGPTSANHAVQAGRSSADDQLPESLPAKRRRVEADKVEPSKPIPSLAEHSSRQKNGDAARSETARVVEKRAVHPSTSSTESRDAKLSTVARPVSPPQISLGKATVTISKEGLATTSKTEALNPRLIPNDPAGHGRRMVYLTALHKELQRLNDAASEHADQQVKRLQLSKADLTKMALDEEETFARDQPTVYANVIKLQIVKYRKMTGDEWVDVRRKAEQAKAPDPKKGKPIETGLSASEEVIMLRRMITNQEGLDQWGYVTSPPTEKEIEDARLGVEAAGGYESCDRCGTRFQVFPDRREDGELTSGGKCVHHWGRPFYPKRQKTDAQVGQQEPRYTCCNELLGTKGCTEAPTHVYKVSEAKRLAAVLPFEETPADAKDSAFEAVCFDCEMGYTVHGFELIRVTAVSWPEGRALLDVLVRPVGAVLDLNSRFSGVFPEHMAKAKELDVAAWREKIQTTKRDTPDEWPDDLSGDLEIVPSPAVARELLTDLLSQQTLLVGHALENDLNAVRIVHPRIVDTVFLFPHPRGLPYRYGLRHLALQHLERHIQAAGAAGHSSLEDARATGDVARCKVKAEWVNLRLSGWTVKDGEFFAPGEGKTEEAVPSDLPEYKDSVQSRKRKRQKSETIGQTDGADEDKGASDA